MLAAASSLLLIGNDGTNDENREAAALPMLSRESALSGEFAADFDAYINDRIAFRNELIGASNNLLSYKGIPSPAGTVIRAAIDMGTGEKQSADIVIHDGKVMELFEKKPDLFNKYADIVNRYAEALPNSNIYSAIIPTQLEFEDSMYSNLEDSQRDAINYIYSRLSDKITCVNMYDALRAHTGEYIYFKTDHHWTALGAYYAYVELCMTTGVDNVDISDFEKQQTESFDGYLSRFVTAHSAEVGEDVFEWYDTDKDKKIKYYMRAFDEDGSSHRYTTPIFYTERDDYDFFLGADHPMAVYENNEVKNGKTMLVVSDSFINALAPWLVKSYSRLVLINPRSYYSTLKAAADEFKPDDVMILDYIFASTFADYCDTMARLLE